MVGGGGRALLSSEKFLQMRSASLPWFQLTGDCCLGDRLEFDDWLATGEWLSGDPLLTPLSVSFLGIQISPKKSLSRAVSMLLGDDESVVW